MTTTRILMTVGQAWSADKPSETREEKCASARPPPPLATSTAHVAARELRETPATRDQALQHLRGWLQRNADVKNVRLDETFLLRFLRLKKFSIPMAQQTLLKYLNLRQYYPEMSLALDCENPTLREVIASGYIVISPVRDSHGRKVIIYDIGKFDASKFGCWEMARAHWLVYESLLEEQENQVLGFTHVGDLAGAGAAHVAAWNPVHFARLIKWGEGTTTVLKMLASCRAKHVEVDDITHYITQSIPMRHKEVHLINVPSTIKYVLDFACSKMSPKIVNRLHIHSSIKTLHKKVDAACLPVSYGGSVPAEQMMSYTREVLLKQRAKVLGLDFMQIISTKGILSSRSQPASNEDSIQGSFRKLEID